MPFPYKHANGSRCCSSPIGMCPRCAAKVRREALAGWTVPPEILKAAQQAVIAHKNMRAAASNAGQLRTGVHIAEEIKMNDHTAPDSYAPALAARRAAEATPESKFVEHYAAKRLADLAALRCGSNQQDTVNVRALSARERLAKEIQGFGTFRPDAPDPYSEATARAPRPTEATDCPVYQPHGQPPDGYGLALKRQKEATK